MLRFNSFNMPRFAEIEILLEYLGKPNVTHDDVWLVANNSPTIPIFEDIFWQLTLDILKQAILLANPWLADKDINIYVNCADTNISILGEHVTYE